MVLNVMIHLQGSGTSKSYGYYEVYKPCVYLREIFRQDEWWDRTMTPRRQARLENCSSLERVRPHPALAGGVIRHRRVLFRRTSVRVTIPSYTYGHRHEQLKHRGYATLEKLQFPRRPP